MFDIGFLELLVIAIVALLVIGPEQLPSTIRTVSLWLGRLRNSFSEVKSELEREIGADEIKRQLHNEAILKSIKNVEKDVQQSMNTINHELESTVKDLPQPSSGRETGTRKNV